MPTEMKLWRIEEDTPRPVDPNKLNLESRLEGWIREDIGMVNDDLLVIGQQVPTGHTGAIDLLAIDPDANLVVMELKRAMTPRDVVAQALDYASYVQKLGLTDIESIIASKDFFNGKSLNEAFRDKFGEDLPEFVNQTHRIYIVASALDSRTERIIEYLSETHGVDINAATFAYFKTPDGSEIIGRSMLLDEEVVERRAKTGGGSKRKPSPTLDGFQAIADGSGVGDLWKRAYDEFVSIPGVRTGRRPNQLNFNVSLDKGQRPRWVLSMFSYPEDGLWIMIHHSRIKRYFNLSGKQLSEVCPEEVVGRWKSYHFDADQLDKLIGLLKANAPEG